MDASIDEANKGYTLPRADHQAVITNRLMENGVIERLARASKFSCRQL
jgi:hypothetical protein